MVDFVDVNTLRYLLAAAALSLALDSAPAADGWLTDFKRAQDEAKTGKKLLLVDFTGSDWCGWCIKLKKEVFSKPEFKEYADKNLVLMEVDFPKGKEQTKEVKLQNEQLAQKYGVQGFPTILVFDEAGKKVGELGYMSSGPNGPPVVQLFIAELEKLRKS